MIFKSLVTVKVRDEMVSFLETQKGKKSWPGYQKDPISSLNSCQLSLLLLIEKVI